MHLAHLLRYSKQRYLQFLPVLTTVAARICTTCRFDSKAELLALFSYTISSKLLHHQYWLPLQDLSNNNRMRLFWVLGLCDIKNNEEADRLARMGSDSHFCGPEPCVPQSTSIVRDMDRNCRQSKLWIEHPNNQIPHESAYKRAGILVSLITGHCCLNKHLHKMGLTASPVCASCQLEEERALHFLYVCPTLATLRTRIFGKPIMNASEFTEVLAFAILRFAFQSGRLETHL
jgi:hypothetical protein